MESSSNRDASLSAMFTQPSAASISPSTLFSLFFTLQLLPVARKYSTDGPYFPSARATAASTCARTCSPYCSYSSGRPVTRVQTSSIAR